MVGPYQMNTIVAWCDETREAVWFDPGAEAESVLRWIQENDLRVTRIVNTHGHVDHIAENSVAKAALNVPLCIHAQDRAKLTDPELNLSHWTGIPVVSPDADEILEEGMQLTCGKLVFELFHVPGHSPGSLVFYAEKNLIAGDTLFYESVGRTDFPDSDTDALFSAIQKKIYSLPDDTIVYPGHGEATTVGHEKLHNPFVRG
ncbi:MAG: MBL fold metallo-hydrolase [Calditrichaeota bacterium]|nr:MBL fold metallo-hydrolase [Calditrichota bacterium]MCB9391929.1 MBL fold metallo-hydrolase [Calditrichota bacterium]